ncbi:NAD-binding protein [Streptomyces sp. NPDC001980]|uniref:NAD-binding protein n=1 Tax=Streptomyces sp. NPDC001980 TaxID=3157126 RepID=UPI003316B5FC
MVQTMPSVLEAPEHSRSVGHMVLCGNGALTRQTAHHLREVYAADVRVIPFDRERGHGLRAAGAWTDGADWAAREADGHPLAAEMTEAGVESASAFGVLMDDPRDVLPIALLALRLNPGIRLVLRCESTAWFSVLEESLSRAGAASYTVLAPWHLAGVNIVTRFFGISGAVSAPSGFTVYVAERPAAEPTPDRGSASVPIALRDDAGDVSLLPPDSVVAAAAPDRTVVELRSSPPHRGNLPSNGHVVLVGLGRTGTGVLEQLLALGLEVVAVDSDPSADGLDVAELQSVPVIVGDARQPEVLAAARVDQCAAVIALTGRYAVNMDVAWLVHGRRPLVRVAARDDRESDEIHEIHDRPRPLPEEFRTYNMPMLAAPSFAAAMAGSTAAGSVPVGRRVLLLLERDVDDFGDAPRSILDRAFRPGKWRVVALNGDRDPSNATWSWTPAAEPPSGARRALVIATRKGVLELLGDGSARSSCDAADEVPEPSEATAASDRSEQAATDAGRDRSAVGAVPASRPRPLRLFLGMLGLAAALWCVLEFLPSGRGLWWPVTLLVTWVSLTAALARRRRPPRPAAEPPDRLVLARLAEMYAALGPPPEPDDGQGAPPDPDGTGPAPQLSWPTGLFQHTERLGRHA